MVNSKVSRKEYIESLDCKKEKCYKCGNRINIRICQIHVNICNNPLIKFFCSKQCKLAWIFDRIIKKFNLYIIN